MYKMTMMQVISKSRQAKGAFNGGEIVENKPIGFNREGGEVRPYSSLFYWANAIATTDSTIGLHPHQGFEILSFVLEGEIRHYDTKAQQWITLHQGDVQIIRSGNGISHSEFMAEGGRMFQIWLDPNLSKTMEQPASYDDYRREDFQVISSDDGIIKTPYIGQDGIIKVDTPNITVQKWDISANTNTKIAKAPENVLSIYLLDGEISLNETSLAVDDFVIINDTDEIAINGEGSLFIIESPKQMSYPTYADIMQQRMMSRGH